MKGINQGPRVAAPVRLSSGLVTGRADRDAAALHGDGAGLRDPHTPEEPAQVSPLGQILLTWGVIFAESPQEAENQWHGPWGIAKQPL